MKGLARFCNGWSGVAVLTALLGSLLLPAPARASCGDYVHLSAPSHRSASSENREQFSKNVIATTEAHTPAKHQAPCSGPNCSRRPVRPAPEPIASVVLGSEQWASLATVPVPELPQPGITLFEGRAGHAVRGLLTVFHPPRS